MPAKHGNLTLPFALAALAAALLAAPSALAASARYEGISDEGKVAVFSTVEKLVPGDTDLQRDVYVRELDEELGYVTREASLGPTGGNDAYGAQFLAIDTAGDRVFFATRERLTAADEDGAEDVYVRDLAEDTTTLVSAGDPFCAVAGCGTANVDAGAAPGGVGLDEGNRVFFVSTEPLSPQDKDASADVYIRDIEEGTTALVSAAAPSCVGSCGNGVQPAVFQDASADGSKAIFTSAESLAGGDADGESDLYERDLESGETKLVSFPGPGPEACPAGHSCEPVNSSISANGGHVFFETNERAAVGDSDESQDVYDWSGGTAARVSTGSGGGNEKNNALFEGSSASGAAVFFATSEPLVGTDGDEAQDVYVRQAGETELVSEGEPACQPGCGNGTLPASLAWVAAAGTPAVLSTAEPLVDADKDSRADVYARALPGGPTTLVSTPGPTCVDPECGNGAHNASFAGSSADGSHLFFVTDEALAPPLEGDESGPGDREERTDVYERSGGTTTLVSAGQLGGSGLYSGNGAFDSQLDPERQGVAVDGGRAFFTTDERLTEADHDSEEDVYERSASGTVLVSQGNDPELEALLAPPAPILEATDPESPGASTEPRVLGSESVAEASIKLYRTADCSGEPAATGSSAGLESPGIDVSVAPGSSTAFRATAEAEGFISECSEPLTYEQLDPEPEGSGGGGSGGSGSGGGSSGSGSGSGSTPFPGFGSIPTKPRGANGHVIPVTRITFAPVFKTRIPDPVFRFTDATGQAGTRFVCRVDRRAWKRCSSPKRLKGLKRGKHLFEVKGINAVGEAEPKPTRRAFKLVGTGGGHR